MSTFVYRTRPPFLASSMPSIQFLDSLSFLIILPFALYRSQSAHCDDLGKTHECHVRYGIIYSQTACQIKH